MVQRFRSRLHNAIARTSERTSRRSPRFCRTTKPTRRAPDADPAVKPVSQGRLKASIASVAVAAVCLLFISTLPRSGPYRIGAARLSGWKLVMEPGGTAFIALQPPPELSADLFRQAVQRTGMALVAPEHPSIPLILQSE